jgi:uncharacterized protein (DUF427 family)
LGVELPEEDFAMPTPGSAHYITLEKSPQRWRVRAGDHVIADTGDALILREGALPPAVYFPRQDVALEYMGRTQHHTHCPFKGDAAYYTLTLDGEILENVAWTYEQPLEEVSPIDSRIAFYANRVEVYAVDDAVVNPHPRPRREEPVVREETTPRDQVDEIIQHTDAGGGVSQREHWAPNVETPNEGGVR